MKRRMTQTHDHLPRLADESTYLLTVRTDQRGEKLEVQVHARTAAAAIRRVLRRAAFADGRIVVTRVDAELVG